MFGGVELGGTKTIVVAGSGPDDLVRVVRIPTTTPDATLEAAIAALREPLPEGTRLDAVGIGAFGPVELDPGRPGSGGTLRTPKPGWSHVAIVPRVRAALGVPVGFETDVTAAALGEGRWGAAHGLGTYAYVTVGTGIGGGLVVGGEVARGLGHPEMGHQRVPRAADDTFTGVCPFHGDCLEGLASGPAIEGRWGRRAETLAGDVLAAAVALEAFYLAAGFANLVYVTAPERIVVGGGVATMPGLLEAVREQLGRLLGGYPGLLGHGEQAFVAAAALGGMAGPLGTLEVARRAAPAPGG